MSRNGVSQRLHVRDWGGGALGGHHDRSLPLGDGGSCGRHGEQCRMAREEKKKKYREARRLAKQGAHRLL